MKARRVAIVDYGLGNLFNLSRVVEHLGGNPVITAAPETIRSADKVILPGVGAFGEGMANLRQEGLEEVVREVAAEGNDLLGICLGMQLLMTSSEEDGEHRGLDLIPGRVERIRVNSQERHKVPQIGWNTIRPREGQARESWSESVLEGVQEDAHMYFIHSYCVRTERDEDTLAVTSYGGDTFSSVVQNENVLGCQFHPERSAHDGIEFLRRFMERRLQG